MFFFRKNYYYPDMPKNFQISQYDRAGGVPLAVDGFLHFDVNRKRKKVRISRVHLEEDPGRLVHLGPIDQSPYTLVDYNRSGITLLEVVTDPDLNSPKEARILLQRLRSILEHLEIFDGNFEGAMRCDANISIAGGTRVEIEIMRQRGLLKNGLAVKRETRHWDETRRITITLRTKEEEHDYRYFPEPDLVPITITKDFIEETKDRMPELPEARVQRFMKTYNLPQYGAEVLVGNKALADFFEECVKICNKPNEVSNWVMSDLLRYLYENNLELSESKITPEHLAEMIRLIEDGVISGKIAKRVLREVVLTGRPPLQIVEKKGWMKIAFRKTLEKMVDRVFSENPMAVDDALTDEKAIHFLVGQLMKETRGKADPALANQIIRERLEKVKAKEKPSN
jgi:aspartyl-tRNA(Asn)/glutamyl-tRNA(Gln) amidotransferase subunit B